MSDFAMLGLFTGGFGLGFLAGVIFALRNRP